MFMSETVRENNEHSSFYVFLGFSACVCFLLLLLLVSVSSHFHDTVEPPKLYFTPMVVCTESIKQANPTNQRKNVTCVKNRLQANWFLPEHLNPSAFCVKIM